jgi:hypothetical protein
MCAGLSDEPGSPEKLLLALNESPDDLNVGILEVFPGFHKGTQETF